MFLFVRDEDDVVEDMGEMILVLGLRGIKCLFLCLVFMLFFMLARCFVLLWVFVCVVMAACELLLL